MILLNPWLLLSNPCTHYSNHINSVVGDIVTGSVLPPEENKNCYYTHQGRQQVSDVVECVCTCLLGGCVRGV